MEKSLVNDNPLLVPLNKQQTVYDGFITVQERDFRMRIVLPPDRQLKEAKYKHPLDVFSLVFDSSQRLQQSADLVGFILELKTVLEVVLKSRPECQYQHLFSLNEQCSNMVPFPTYMVPGYCASNLPVELLADGAPRINSLHSQFLLVLESLTEFWDVLDEIDSKTWILEPEKPCRSDTTRRIAIGNNVSIKVEVDPGHPKMLPECCLLGAEHGGYDLGVKVCLQAATTHLWNPDSSVLHNLRDVLEIEFPSPATHEKSVCHIVAPFSISNVSLHQCVCVCVCVCVFTSLHTFSCLSSEF
uniref:FA complementation group L n=1 Tax=Neolamprologus brichardi TaxID=32507 RepID=A0A3Q4I5S3_NEOBR